MLQASQDQNWEIINKCQVRLTLNPMVTAETALMKELTLLKFKIISVEPFVVENDINPGDFQDTVNKVIGTVIKFSRKEFPEQYKLSDVEKKGSFKEQDNEKTDVKIKRNVSPQDLQQQASQIKSLDANDRGKSIGQEISSYNSTESKTGTLSSSAATYKPDECHDQEIKGNATDEIKENRPKPRTPSTSSQDSDDSEPDAHYMSIKLDLFYAAKHYFKDSEFSQFFEFSVEKGLDVEFNIPSRYIKGRNFISKLKDFKMYEFDGKDKQETIIRYVKEHYSRTIVASQGRYLTLMGFGDEFQQAKKKILTMMGNNDDEQFWSTNRADEKYIDRTILFESNHRVYQGSSGMKIKVYYADITKLEVDCIVNAANRHLKHGGGVAKAIAMAAGYKLQSECNDYIDAYGKVDVTDIFVSSGVRLPAKNVIHAVGPKWDDYTDKPRCVDDLRRTIVRCLTEASKMQVSSIAFPSISAAIFKVPQDHCAESYMTAVKNFDLIAMELKLTSPREVSFVDVNQEMIDVINNWFSEYWRLEPDEKIYTEDLQFVKKQLEPKTLKPRQKVQAFSNDSGKVQVGSSGNSKPHIPKNNSSLRPDAAEFHPGGKEKIYSVGRVNLYVSNKCAFDVHCNLIVTIGEPFNALSGSPGFKTDNLKTFHRIKNAEFLTFESRDKTSYNICKISIEDSDIEKLQYAFENLKSAISLTQETFRSIVITSKLLYPEQSRDKKNPPPKQVGTFAGLVYKFIKDFTDNPKSPSVVIVTASEAVLSKISEVFTSREKNPKQHEQKPGIGCNPLTKKKKGNY